MVNVIICQKQNGEYTGFSVTGHAEAAAYGEDIVCAAISAIVQSALIALEEIVKINENAFEIEQGDVSLQMPADLSKQATHDAWVVLETMKLGLQSVAVDREEYLHIEIRRVE